MGFALVAGRLAQPEMDLRLDRRLRASAVSICSLVSQNHALIQSRSLSTSLGFCRNGRCAGVPVRNVGETCPSSDVCVGAESYQELAPLCGNIPGAEGICGGASTTCYGLDGLGTGPDPICASGKFIERVICNQLTRNRSFDRTGQCKAYQCQSTEPSGTGQACLGDFQCEGDVRCPNGFCVGGGAFCTATDGSQTGSTTTCLSGEYLAILMLESTYPTTLILL
jgi:hypothetical protein